MPYDLIIKNGTVIDGTGLPRYRADVAVRHGRIAAIGRMRESARKVVDADGQVATPGFIDGHTHMDAQVFWDPGILANENQGARQAGPRPRAGRSYAELRARHALGIRGSRAHPRGHGRRSARLRSRTRSRPRCPGSGAICRRERGGSPNARGGIAATVVNGEVVLRDGEPTGAPPGQLLRGGRARH